jgi:hypothetical protein
VSNSWYYADQNGQVGPLSLGELKETLRTFDKLGDVLVWCDRFPDWKRAIDIPEIAGTTKAPPPPLPRTNGAGSTVASPSQTSARKSKAPIIGIVSVGLGFGSVVMPYFAAVFFVPAAFTCAVVALVRRQVAWGTAAILLSSLGLGEIIYTSQQIASIFTAKPGHISLPQPAFAPPPIVTQAQYDQIREGMTYEQVRNVIGTDGQELSRSNLAGYSTVMYSWTNSNGSNMNAMFQNDRLINKAQFSLPETAPESEQHLTAATLSKGVAEITKSCIATYGEGQTGTVSRPLYEKFCGCYAETLLDRLSPSELKDLDSPLAKSATTEAGKRCYKVVKDEEMRNTATGK